MKHALILAAVLVTSLPGQIIELATTGDGAELHFSSGYTLRDDGGGDTGIFPASRIYRYQPGTPEILAGLGGPVGPAPNKPYLSSDGQTRGWYTFQTCFGSCIIFTPRGGLTVTRQGKTSQFTGDQLRLSRNGRWLFDSGYPVVSPTFVPRLIDLETGVSRTMPRQTVSHPTHMVADDGTLVSPFEGNRLRVTAADSVVDFTMPEAIISAALATDAARVLAISQTRLYLIDVATGTQRIVYEAQDTLTRFTLSDAGDRVLLRDGARLVRWDSASEARVLNEFGGGEVLLSGDGRVAYSGEPANQLVRIALDSGERTVLYPEFASWFNQSLGGAVPGSLTRLSGGPFNDRQVLRVRGREFPMVAVTPETYEAQIPWDFPVGQNNPVELSRPGSPFVIRGGLFLSARVSPAVYTLNGFEGRVKAVQRDFGSLVSQESPAVAGTSIHFWLTGLGPLDRPVATGEPGPSDPPARPVAPVACYLEGGLPARGLRVLFLGYAPGLVGVYQVEAEIPADWPAGEANLFCRSGDSVTSMGGKLQVARP
ncbi:MAG: hypothetical protein K2X03_20025 [Bryobacteraceae bacterium]|nr:hypothetical protein [Bryobacteraceae bacterium]